VPYLVPLGKEDLLACFIGVDVLDHPVRVKVDELDRERLKCVTLGYIVLNALLKFLLCESMTTDPFELVVGNSRRKQVA